MPATLENKWLFFYLAGIILPKKNTPNVARNHCSSLNLSLFLEQM